MQIALDDMDNEHVIHEITKIVKKATEGFVVTESGGEDTHDYWVNQYYVKGEEALNYLNFQAYVDEAVKRGIIKGNYNEHI